MRDYGYDGCTFLTWYAGNAQHTWVTDVEGVQQVVGPRHIHDHHLCGGVCARTDPNTTGHLHMQRLLPLLSTHTISLYQQPTLSMLPMNVFRGMCVLYVGLIHFYTSQWLSHENPSLNVTLDHKTSHKCQFFDIKISTSSESWLNKLSIDVWFVRTIFGRDTTIWKAGIWGCKKNQNTEKITLKVV